MQRGYLNGLIWVLGIGLALAIPGKCGTAREEVKTNSSKMGSLVLARAGVGEAVIVVGKNPTAAALFGAQELQEHVRKITGAILPVMREGEEIQGQCIYVGESEGTRKYGLTNGSFAAQEYTIKFVPDGLILMGRDKDNSAASLGPKDSAVPQVELHGEFKWREGKYGKGLSSSNGVLVVNEPGFNDEEGTLEAWVWLPAGGNKEGGGIMRLEGGKPYGHHIVNVLSNNRLVYTVYNDKTKKKSEVTSGELGEGWHHVMAVHDVKKGKMGLAVDGVGCGEGEYQEATACSGAVLKIGGFLRDGKVSNGLDGGVDELRVSNLARPVGKVDGPFALDFNTVCLMHFDEGAGIPGKTMGMVKPPDMFDEQGTSYAVHDFLERFCDVRWYGPTELGMVCPERRTLEVKGREVRRKPALFYRALGATYLSKRFQPMEVILMNNATEKEMLLFFSRLKVGGEFVTASHSFYGYYDRYWKKNPEHPELFEGEHHEYFNKDWPAGYKEKYGEEYVKYGSKNRPDQMCYSNPGFINQVVQDARDFFDGKGLKPGAVAHGDIFALEPMDTGFWCLCPECQKLIDETQCRTNEWQSGITGDYLVNFANKVAREIKKSHPDKK
ncbi:MAG: DUF4838 domain-containing protein, partial [Deltaproteobacteria bacterium]|nr:DUF4838 domain-containing protein [Deltaproteobacteria bacterium]